AGITRRSNIVERRAAGAGKTYPAASAFYGCHPAGRHDQYWPLCAGQCIARHSERNGRAGYRSHPRRHYRIIIQAPVFTARGQKYPFYRVGPGSYYRTAGANQPPGYDRTVGASAERYGSARVPLRRFYATHPAPIPTAGATGADHTNSGGGVTGRKNGGQKTL